MHAWAEVCPLSQSSSKSVFTGFFSRCVQYGLKNHWPGICSSTEWMWNDKAKQLPVSRHMDCISNPTNLSKDFSLLLSTLCACWCHNWSHSCWVTSLKHTRLRNCEKAMGWCTAQCKMLLFCVKTVMKASPWHSFELACLKNTKGSLGNTLSSYALLKQTERFKMWEEQYSAKECAKIG